MSKCPKSLHPGKGLTLFTMSPKGLEQDIKINNRDLPTQLCQGKLPIICNPSVTHLIPFCNLRLQKGIRKVSERYQKGIR